MRNKELITIIAIISLVGLTACSSPSTANTEISESINTFEPNDFTIHKSDESILKSGDPEQQKRETLDSEAEANMKEDEENRAHYGELVLKGDDSSRDYDVVNNRDIQYHDKLYKNLYYNINKIETKYNKNTLINFIIKTYKSESSTIYTELDQSDYSKPNEDGFDIDDSIDSNVYEKLKDKYSEKATWILYLRDSETGEQHMIFGAKNYMLAEQSQNYYEVDMNK